LSINRNMPSHQLCEFIPYLSITDATKALAFYTEVFGDLLKMPDGRVMHCEFRLGNARFYLSEELPEHGGTPSPESLCGTSVAIHVYIDDCDAMIEMMKDNGATVLMEPTDMFWGERFGRVRDPFGHEWGIATQLREMSPDEIQAAAHQLFADKSE
jgi:PhnB protein